MTTPMEDAMAAFWDERFGHTTLRDTARMQAALRVFAFECSPATRVEILTLIQTKPHQ